MKLTAAALTICMLFGITLQASATTVDDIQNEINSIEKDISSIEQQKKNAQQQANDAKNKLSGINSQISSISGAMGDLGEEIDSVSEELVGLLTAINMIETDIENKKEEIAQTEIEYEEAVRVENEQYEAMKIRAKYMYEQGEKSYLSIFLESESLSDALNKADYIEQLYSYDRAMLEKYKLAVSHTKDVWDKLEEEKSELETSEIELKGEKATLEEVQRELKTEYENYDVMLSKAKQQAASFTAKINQETDKIKKLEQEKKKKEEQAEAKKKEKEDAKKKAEKEAAEAALAAGDINKASEIAETSIAESSRTSSDSSKKSVPTVSGSGTGASVASYALQFVGNPYVAGGTSLTKGADCSGFVQSVYKNFGVSLPRSSYSQSTVGKSVSYSDAQAGDIIYYGGHVGIYIGNGQIVHASTERTGIKVSSATYRSIVSIRRVL